MLSLVQLTDADIVLRPFQAEDSTQLHHAVRESLQELKPWMSWATENYTEFTARDYIAITQNNELLGSCTLSSIHPIYHFCNVGYWVRTSKHGQGIAGRAAKLAARFAFEHVGLVRAEIVIARDNMASRRVAEKIGAHYEGILLNRMIIGPAVSDAHMYSLLPSDFGLAARL